MENKKTNNVLIIILSVLLLCSFGIIGYLLGSNNGKITDNDIKEEVKQENEEREEITPVAYTPKIVSSGFGGVYLPTLKISY